MKEFEGCVAHLKSMPREGWIGLIALAALALAAFAIHFGEGLIAWIALAALALAAFAIHSVKTVANRKS